MPESFISYVGENAADHLADYLKTQKFEIITLVADKNTYAALGKQVEDTLRAKKFPIEVVILPGEQIKADEISVVQTLLPVDLRERMFISIGSGTITDVVRFASYRNKSCFVSMPTAASVDGFGASGSAMTIRKLKQTIISRAPLAVFADVETLSKAPRLLTASGFADMFGKFTALADWRLGNILIDEKYLPEVAQRSRQAVENCVQRANHLDEDWKGDVSTLMQALLDEGYCMIDAGNTRPASGSEHQLSHYWEMMLEREDRPAVFHGVKVGIGSIFIARYYQFIRSLSRQQAAERLQRSTLPDRDKEIALIQAGYGVITDQIVKAQARYLDMTPADYENLKQRILDNWDIIQEIAAAVPEPETIRDLLSKVGSPTEPSAIGLNDKDVRDAIIYGRYIRTAFTVVHVSRMLGVQSILEDWK